MTQLPDDPPRVDFASPANASVLRFLRIEDPSRARTTRPRGMGLLALGTHPDLVEYLWKLPAGEPDCVACVINERSYPLLTHARSRIIFALAGGTSTLALRLPEPELSVALAVPGFGREYRYPGGPVSAAAIGDGWALVKPFSESNVGWCRRAFEHAGTLSRGPHGGALPDPHLIDQHAPLRIRLNVADATGDDHGIPRVHDRHPRDELRHQAIDGGPGCVRRGLRIGGLPGSAHSRLPGRCAGRRSRRRCCCSC